MTGWDKHAHLVGEGMEGISISITTLPAETHTDAQLRAEFFPGGRQRFRPTLVKLRTPSEIFLFPDCKNCQFPYSKSRR
jgi:hypothetical protein